MQHETYIEINPKIMMGKPVIKGTRITVELILEKLAAEDSIEDILSEHPRLKRAHIFAALAFAANMLKGEKIIALAA
ncbi:MAG: DUF433 domain-containing protein [Saprospiraceae bacterium]|nr:DUF433 domain-containing protein [Saprospiraceae bacterium]